MTGFSPGLTITPVFPKTDSSPVSTNAWPNCYNTGYIERVQDRDENGHLISNDIADYMLVECQICSLHTPQTRLRSHTKSAHGITITEYKAQFGVPDPVEPVYHRYSQLS